MFAAKILEHVHNSQSYFRSSLAVFCGRSFRPDPRFITAVRKVFFSITAGLFWVLGRGADADFRFVNGPCQWISEIYGNRKF